MKWWYDRNIVSYLLWPWSILWQWGARLKSTLYRSGIFKTTHFDVPIIVVGNLTVGGNGKTPFIIGLAQLLIQMGFKPGIVSRGYGGSLKQGTCLVTSDSSPLLVGEEPVLLARRLKCPVVVGQKRVQAVQTLLAHSDCDVILSDDGLQHLAMGRTMEIIIVDGERQFGNGFCLPAGPLREDCQRLQTTPWVIYHSQDPTYPLRFHLQPTLFRALKNMEIVKPLTAFAHQTIDVIVGIGYPQRFLKTLQDLQIQVKPTLFRDHYVYTDKDVATYQNSTLVMTEKDAVKCQPFLLNDAWYLEVDTILNETLQQQLKTYFLTWRQKA